MSELPAGWVSASIGEICSQGEQRIPEADEQFTYIDIASVDRGRKTVMEPQLLRGSEAPSRARKVVATGDVIVSMTRPNLNAIALIGQRHDSAIASTGFDVLRPIEVDPRWIFAAVKSTHFVKAMSAKVQGALYPAIKADDIRKHEIPLPPLAEQKRIAQKLDALLAQVDTLKARIDAIPALLKRFRQSVLTSAATCELTSEWRATQGLDDPVPTKLGELIRTGPQNGLYKPSSTYGSGTKIVRIDGFYSGELRDWHSLRSLQLDAREEQVWALNVGDILINRVNSIEYLGKCALVRSLPGPTVFESNMMRIAVDERVIEPEFLMRALSAEIGRARLIANAKHAVNQASINQGDVKACSILVPTLSEQTEIVRSVEQLFAYADQLEAKVAAAQQRIDALTQSLLAKAFRGELVPQDPTDEPASVLLERIRTQRAATPKPKRGRKKV